LPVNWLIPLNPHKSLSVIKEKPSENKIVLSGNVSFTGKTALNAKINLEMTGSLNPNLLLTRNESKMKEFLSGGIVATDIRIHV